MKLKKILIMASMGLLLFGLASCKQTRKEIISLNVWTYYNGKIETAFQNIINDYNETQGKDDMIRVETSSKGSSVPALSTAVIDSARNNLGSDEMPDIFISYPDCAYEVHKLGLLAPIDDYFNDDELSNFDKRFVAEGVFDNHTMILPAYKSTEALYLNKTDFDKFLSENPNTGITYDDLKTMEGIYNISKIYKEKTGKAFFGRDTLDNYFIVGAKQLGIDILDYNDDGIYCINYDEEVFKKLWDSYYVPYVYGYFDSIGKFKSSDIQSGDLLCYVGSTTSVQYLSNKVHDENPHDITIEILPSPTFKGKPFISASQGAGFCITKSDKEREKAAASFLKWLTKKENITTFCTESSYFPATIDGFSEDFIKNQESPLLRNNFSVCKEIINTHIMYTNSAGLNGSELRESLKTDFDALLKKAKSMLANSSDKDATIRQLISREAFETWFNNLKIRKTI